MATHKLTNAGIWLSGYDVSGDHNMVEMPNGVESLDKTTFGQTTRIHQAGLYETDLKGQCLLSYGTSEIEDIIRGLLAVTDTPCTVTPNGATAGDRAYFSQYLTVNAKLLGGTVGDLHVGTWDAKGSGGFPLVPGTLMAAKSARGSSSNSGTALQLGAVAAGQRIYAALHVFAVSGSTPTLAVTVKSDNGVGFGTPATQITFATANAIGAQFSSAAGAITDDYWRVDWTIGGSTPSFTFAVAIGIF